MKGREQVESAYVLRHHELGEADKIVVLFTRERGLGRAVARAVRKAKSPLAGRLEPFNELELTLVSGRSLQTISHSQTLRRFPHVVSDFDGLAAAMSANELLLSLLETDDPHPDLFDAYGALLALLQPPCRAELLLASFEMQLLTALGYRPELESCIRCGCALDEGEALGGLAVEEGGVACLDCRDGTRPLSLGAWRLLQALQETPLAASPALRATDDLVIQVRHALKAYTAVRAERDLRAQRMFDWRGQQAP
ncbi:MAG: DNA repair protein RecO [Candidatus Sericytochromatia bacterium]|nr:DNA repair protein RecO [Candidatus Sericytochromatia bacterium]